jgi:hypothetical protein
VVRLPADVNGVSTLNFRSDYASDPDRERDAISRPDLKLIATQDELDAVRAQLDGAQVELRTLRSQFQSSSIVREALDLERTRALRAESALHTERDRTEAALAAVTDAQQKAAAALAELAAERQDVAALRDALSEASSSPNAGMRLISGPTWDGTAQRAVAEAIAEVSDWRIALKEIVRVLGALGGWDAVVAWCPEERRPGFCCVGMWTGHDSSLRALETKTWQARRQPTAAEFGTARARANATCFPTLDGAEDRLLRDAAEAGIESVMYVPIRVENEVIGVIELWSRRSAEPDGDVVLFLEAIGLQLGSHAGLINAAASPRWRVGRY